MCSRTKVDGPSQMMLFNSMKTILIFYERTSISYIKQYRLIIRPRIFAEVIHLIIYCPLISILYIVILNYYTIYFLSVLRAFSGFENGMATVQVIIGFSGACLIATSYNIIAHSLQADQVEICFLCRQWLNFGLK